MLGMLLYHDLLWWWQVVKASPHLTSEEQYIIGFIAVNAIKMYLCIYADVGILIYCYTVVKI